MSVKWEKINSFLLQCGNQRTPEDLGCQIMNEIGNLISFDQGRLYFLDGNGNVQKEYLLGVKKKTTREYHDYYCKYDEGRYSTTYAASWFAKNYPAVEQCVFSPNSYGTSRFYAEYIKPHHINYSFGLGLRDNRQSLRCMFSLDRTSNVSYNEQDIEIMSIVRPHLDNMLQNLYVSLPEESVNHFYEDFPLTNREKEICDLLKEGISPQNISINLRISYTTVKKHMDNIYKKLHVNSLQELLLKLLKK